MHEALSRPTVPGAGTGKRPPTGGGEPPRSPYARSPGFEPGICRVGADCLIRWARSACSVTTSHACRKIVNRSGDHLALVENYQGEYGFVELTHVRQVIGIYLDD